MKPRRRILELFYRSGLFHLSDRLLGKSRLTVLAYHRICDPEVPGFQGLEAMVGATPAEFGEQMDFMRRRFHMISIGELVSWLRGRGPLPPKPALITFDDGYYDNFIHALPLLRERGIPALIFLATDYIGNQKTFFWDFIAHCFRHAPPRGAAELPILGYRKWNDERSRALTMRTLLKALKLVPDHAKEQIVQAIPDTLGVRVREGDIAGSCLNWDHVRTMVAAGIDMGAHTQSHAILTRISPMQARQEILGSRLRIESEINCRVQTFAYPNGSRLDFNPMLQTICAESGLEAAFTLRPGPSSVNVVKRSPMAIRRILVTRSGGLPGFAARVVGLGALKG